MKKLLMVATILVALVTSVVSAKVIGSVNGYKVTEAEANKLLKVLTNGKVKYSQLSPKDKREIVKRLAIDKIVIKAAYRGLTKKERDFVIANAWMAKKIRNIKVSDAEARKIYNQNKQLFKDRKTGKILPFRKVKNAIKLQLKQKKVIDRLLRKAKITVYK